MIVPDEHNRAGTAVLNLFIGSAGIPGPDARRAGELWDHVFKRLYPPCRLLRQVKHRASGCDAPDRLARMVSCSGTTSENS